MKRLQAAAFALSFSCIFLFSGQTDARSSIDGDEWSPLKRDVYIKEESITRPSDTTVSLWMKVVPRTDSASLADIRGSLLNTIRDNKGFTYDYTGYLSEIDCKEKKHREWAAILYDSNDNVIHSVRHHEPSWDIIASGSSFDVVQKSLCKYD